jgi:phosphate transport system substrate-binding protein
MGTAYTTSESPCQFGESDTSIASTQYTLLPTGSNLLTVPISDSGIVPAYNLPGVTAHLNFTGNVLAEIFYGTITQWNDPRIASLNPHVTLPAHAIQVYHRSDSSWSTYAFAQYLSDSNSTWRTSLGYATSVPWPTGIGCYHNDGEAKCITDTQYSLGPLEVPYEIANPGQINYGAVQNHAGNFSLANLHTIQLAMNAGAKNGLPTSASQWSSFSLVDNIFNDSTAADIYPITTFVYALTYQNLSAPYAYMTEAQAVAIVNFLSWVVNSGQKTGDFLGYPALPSSVVTFDNQVLGSITYNGTPVYTGS